MAVALTAGKKKTGQSEMAARLVLSILLQKVSIIIINSVILKTRSFI